MLSVRYDTYMTSADYAQDQREKKIGKLIVRALARGMTAGDMAIMLDEHWTALEKAAGVNKCSAETRRQCLDTFRQVEARRDEPVADVKFPKF